MTSPTIKNEEEEPTTTVYEEEEEVPLVVPSPAKRRRSQRSKNPSDREEKLRFETQRSKENMLGEDIYFRYLKPAGFKDLPNCELNSAWKYHKGEIVFFHYYEIWHKWNSDKEFQKQVKADIKKLEAIKKKRGRPTAAAASEDEDEDEDEGRNNKQEGNKCAKQQGMESPRVTTVLREPSTIVTPAAAAAAATAAASVTTPIAGADLQEEATNEEDCLRLAAQQTKIIIKDLEKKLHAQNLKLQAQNFEIEHLENENKKLRKENANAKAAAAAAAQWE